MVWCSTTINRKIHEIQSMSLNVDIEYVSTVCYRYQNFKQVKPRVWNFRCPICGDSKKDETLARGYVYQHKKHTDNLWYHCHNCGEHCSLKFFFKKVEPEVFKEYQLQAFKEKIGDRNRKTKPDDVIEIDTKPKTIPLDTLSYLPTIADLAPDHPCRQYVASRRIPLFQYDKLYYSEDYAETACRVDDEVSGLREGEPRLVIPMITVDNQLSGIIGRDLRPKSKLRYITIKVSPSSDKVFGINRIDKSKKVFIMEGAIDSMFVNNGIAVAGSGLLSQKLDIPVENRVYVYDNEPLNKEISNMLLNTIEHGYNVVIFPSKIREKDINDMVLHHIDINSLLNDNIYSGLEARAKYSSWINLR